MRTLKIAVISDVHGNRWALDAVLADLLHDWIFHLFAEVSMWTFFSMSSSNHV